jgi:hypothetical protein
MSNAMPIHQTRFWLSLLLMVVVSHGVAQAGDDFNGNWGISSSDDRIVLYLGKGRIVETSIPTPPSGPRWDIAYGAMPFMAVGVAAGWYVWRVRRRVRTTRRTGFEVQLKAEHSPDEASP